ncbi:MAG: hypothetical protein JSV92_00975 [archaeon]|nr:MAG: hypothetical protein JSV92_00975 [archaeon]
MMTEELSLEGYMELDVGKESQDKNFQCARRVSFYDTLNEEEFERYKKDRIEFMKKERHFFKCLKNISIKNNPKIFTFKYEKLYEGVAVKGVDELYEAGEPVFVIDRFELDGPTAAFCLFFEKYAPVLFNAITKQFEDPQVRVMEIKIFDKEREREKIYKKFQEYSKNKGLEFCCTDKNLFYFTKK